MFLKPSIEFSRLPVTALAFLDGQNLLILGQGPHLRIVDCRTAATIYSKQFFVDQAIHGIAVYNFSSSSWMVLAWGGRVFCGAVVDISGSNIRRPVVDVRPGKLNSCSDWIVHCAFRDAESADLSCRLRAAAVTAHNALIMLVFDPTERNAEPIPSSSLRISQIYLSAATRCMLYSAYIQWISAEYILITAGTPFGTIIVWSCLIKDNLQGGILGQAVVKTHYVFTAHENSAVFGVVSLKYLPDAVTHAQKLLVASCSDDRTIKVWDISMVLPELRSIIEDTRITEANAGLDRPYLEPEDAQASSDSITCAYATTFPSSPQRLYGHRSRVWNIGLVGDEVNKASPVRSSILISLGEDATVQLWQLNGGLSHIATYANHAGKNIWASATSVLNNDQALIATGGYDGAVVATKPTSLAKFHKSGPELKPKKVDNRIWTDGLKSYSFIGSNVLLATKLDGSVLLGRYAAKESDTSLQHPQFKFGTEGHFADLENYSTTTGISSLNLGFAGGTKGTIYCFYNRHIDQNPVAKLDGNIGGLFSQVLPDQLVHDKNGPMPTVVYIGIALLATEMRASSARLYLLQAKMKEGICVSVTPVPPVADSRDITFYGPSEMDIHVPKNATVTSMLYLHVEKLGDLLLLGTRSGAVIRYLLNYTSKNAPASSTNQDLTFEHVGSSATYHHQDAVTCMEWSIGEYGPHPAKYGFLLSTGRDSTYAIHRYSLQDLKATPEVVHRIALPFGPNVEGFYFAGPAQSMHLYGFRGEDFVIFEESTHAEKMKVKCGGAHRVWAFQPPLNSNDATLVWTRASKFYSHTASPSASQWLQHGGHGREIKACAVCPKVFLEGRMHSYLVATGAEDTDIRLFIYCPTAESQRHSTLRNVAILREHVTGLQYLQFSDDGRYLFSCGGREELFVWRLERTPFVRIGVVCESKLPQISAVTDLRIMGFDVMSVVARTTDSEALDNAEFVVSLVLSNSTTRVYRYTTGILNPAWHLLANATYGTSCLTVGEFMLHPQPPRLPETRSIDFIVAGTDGSMILWNFQRWNDTDERQHDCMKRGKILTQSKIHQNTVKCLKSIPLSSPAGHEDHEVSLVICGGDDNALSFTLVRKQHSSREENAMSALGTDLKPNVETLLLPRAHAASVTGLVVWDKGSCEGDTGSDEPISELLLNKARFRMATISNDQRLKLWDVDVDLRKPGVTGIQVRKISNVFSGVADASSVALQVVDDASTEISVCKEQSEVRLMVCGVGMEVWKIPHTNGDIGRLRVVQDGS